MSMSIWGGTGIPPIGTGITGRAGILIGAGTGDGTGVGTGALPGVGAGVGGLTGIIPIGDGAVISIIGIRRAVGITTGMSSMAVVGLR